LNLNHLEVNMKKHDALQGWPRVCSGLTVACLVLFSFSPASAAGASVGEGFNVKVRLLPAAPKPIAGNEPTSPPISTANNPPSNQTGSACTLSSLKLPSSSQLNISCTAAEVIASRYYKMPAYTWFNAGQTALKMPGQSSGIGLGTTSSMRVLHEPDDELIEVWVSW
jgi:hypothetical protein